MPRRHQTLAWRTFSTCDNDEDNQSFEAHDAEHGAVSVRLRVCNQVQVEAQPKPIMPCCLAYFKYEICFGKLSGKINTTPITIAVPEPKVSAFTLCALASWPREALVDALLLCPVRN